MASDIGDIIVGILIVLIFLFTLGPSLQETTGYNPFVFYLGMLLLLTGILVGLFRG